MNSVRVENWKGTIVSFPSAIVRPDSAEDIAEIIKDKERYPSPVRAVGSNHSTTRCGVADKGTVVEMKGMNRIIDITDDTVIVEAGALYIDVAKKLEECGLQFFVNVELGNLTIGSACCGGTKDASMPNEFGQVNSYAIGMKFVTPAGELDEVTEADPKRLRIMRSSYGLLGVIYEVTFKVCALKDDNSLFSYSSNGNVMTLDPVSTGDLGWDDFVEAYNELCSSLGGVPLFNQTKGIKPNQAKKAFGKRLDQFAAIRRRADQKNRLLNEYFAQYFL